MVFIRWRDSYGDSSWVPLDKWAEPDNYIVYTVGILLEEDDEYYRIAQSITLAELKDNWMCIPKKAVIEISELRKYNLRKKHEQNKTP